MMPRASASEEGYLATAVVNGITLDYEERGDRRCPTVLLVMGLGGQRILWPDELVDGLVTRGCHVVAFDNRDVGRSTALDGAPGDPEMVAATFAGAPVEAPYRLEDMALDAVGLLDHLGVERAHVVGASMGGMIAQHLAFGHAARVASLTCLNSAAGPWADPQSTAVRVAAPELAPGEREAFVAWFVDGLRALSSPRWFDEAAVRDLARWSYARGVHPEGAIRQLVAILADGDRSDRLRAVTAPTLVIHGAQDPLIHPSAGEAIAQAVDGAELLTVEDMAHDLPLPLVPRIIDALAAHVGAAERAQSGAGVPSGPMRTQPRPGT
jgi:pimeloyl-ACP methyl ester carboxylesterase